MQRPIYRCWLRQAAVLALCASAAGRDASAQDMVRDPTTGGTERVTITADASDAPPPEYAGGQVAEGGRLGLLGDRSVFDTPFSTTDFTARFIKDQQARTTGDILLNDPSVNTQWPRGSFTERYQIRGFTVGGEEASLNGLFGLVPGLLTLPEAFERIELFKGPNSLLNGKVGSVGGSINYVPKRAGSAPNASVSLIYASPEQVGGQIDVGRRFNFDRYGDLGVRFNGTYADGDTEGDLQSQRLGLAALGVDYHWRSLRVSTDLIYQETRNDSPRSQIYAVGDLPYLRPPDAHKSFAQPYEYGAGDDLIGAGRVEYDLTSNILLYAAGGGRFSHDRQSRDIPVLVDGVFDARRGDYGSFPDEYLEWDEADSQQVGGRAFFALGPTRHEFSVSANRLNITTGNDYRVVFDAEANPDGLQNNLYRPAVLPRPDFPHLLYKGPKANESTESSVAVADIVSVLDGRVQAILGGRLQRVESTGFDQTTGAETQSYDESKLTPAYTLLVKPWRQLSLYGSYIEALEQGPVAPDDVSNARQIFPPNVTDQYEVGAKLDLGRLGLTLAWFQITQPFGQTTASVDGVLTFSVDGEQRNRGVEFGAFGEPYKGVRLLGGVTYLDPVLQNTADGLLDGSTPQGNSEFVVNFNAEWDVPYLPGFTLTGRVNYQTSQYIDTENRVEIPSWTRVDLGARYAHKVAGRLTTLRVTCTNVADRNYWASAANGYLLAAPRTFLTSLTVDF